MPGRNRQRRRIHERIPVLAYAGRARSLESAEPRKTGSFRRRDRLSSGSSASARPFGPAMCMAPIGVWTARFLPASTSLFPDTHTGPPTVVAIGRPTMNLWLTPRFNSSTPAGLSLAAFCPIFRTHGHRPHNEVWSFDKVEPILVNYDRLRYRLMPCIDRLPGR